MGTPAVLPVSFRGDLTAEEEPYLESQIAWMREG